MKREKILLGGYYDERVFEGEYFYGKTPFNRDVNIYSVDEALKLDFVGDYFKDYLDENEIEFDDFCMRSEKEKAELISRFIEPDEVAGLIVCDDGEKARESLNRVVKELKDIDKKIYNEEVIFLEYRKNNYGKMLRVYRHISDL